MLPERKPTPRPISRGRLHVAAFGFVIVALIALALTPTLVLDRVSAASRERTTTLLPVYDRLWQLALTMERQSVAVRGFLLSGDPRYRVRLQEAQAAEAEAFRGLGPLVRRISPGLDDNFAALERLSARRYAHNALLMETSAGVEAHQAALPELELVRDSMFRHIAVIEREVVRVAAARARAEARWAARQQWLSLFLGALALPAVLLVGWFARRQHRLTEEVERALAESNRLRAESEERREALERVTESRARLMRGFSHDVKNPLGAADGYLQLLAGGIMGPLAEKQRRSVQRASRSITAALNLVEDLLDLARAERGHLEVDPAPTDICDVVREAAEEYEAQAEAKGLVIRVQLPEAPLPVTTDGKRVRQVLGNLISNAVKYTPGGMVTIRLDPPPDGDGAPSGHRVPIHVVDTGPGIPTEQRHLLFQEFVRLDPQAGPGAGVGLAISQRIAEVLGGEITVESEPGRGSTFTLWLPTAHRPSENPLTAPSGGDDSHPSAR
jgi:signal transduction histidine kinase